MGLKLNIGSGFKKIDGFLNIDEDPAVEPDYVMNLDDVNIKLPFEDSSVENIVAHHILEHIGDGFIPLMKEMYRVMEHGAVLDVEVPHHFHDVFYGDPTHKRAITVPCMQMFSKKFNREHIKMYGSSSGMGLRHNIDFEMIWYDFDYDQFYIPLLAKINEQTAQGTLSEQDHFTFVRLLREATNVALNTKIKMMAVKE